MNQPSFLQSADWAKFQVAVGHPVVESNGIRFFKNSLLFGGSYWYCPHPDVGDELAFLKSVTELASQEKAWFVRVEPNVGAVSIEYPVLSIEGRQRAKQEGTNESELNTEYRILNTAAVQPSNTWHVSLADEPTMLVTMHEKTRYNIRLAEKRGVTVRFSSDPADASILYDLLAKTGERAGIRLHEASYYRTMMEVLKANSKRQTANSADEVSLADSRSLIADCLTVEIAIAESEGQPVAAALVATFGNRVIYLHGGSEYEQRSLMAPHLLHWSIMQRAHAAGLNVYDMGGIAPGEPETRNQKPETNPVSSFKFQVFRSAPHPWSGITRFKQGFGGEAVHYPPAVDVVVNQFAYWLYNLGRRLNRSLR